MAEANIQDDEKKQEEVASLKLVASDDKLYEHESGGNEKILYSEHLNDRRNKIISSKDTRPIVQCIGRIISIYNEASGTADAGTGTVFDYDEKTSTAYVVTCAHNVVDIVADEEDEEQKNYVNAKKIYFQRNETFENEPAKVIKNYPCNISKYHTDYAEATGMNDLAVLVFKDDGYYGSIFKKDKEIIDVIPSNLIPEQFIFKYFIYGYPIRGTQKCSKVNSGEMWGMDAESYNIVVVDKNNVEMYVRQNTNKTKFFYNALDSEKGQSGSAIFLQLNKGKYGIVGIHTGGSARSGKNYGTALNENKIKWIKSICAKK